jgi:uncharacterized protein
MDVVLAGAVVRAIQGMASAAPTLITGLFVAAILRYYLRVEGTVRLFGGCGVRSLVQSWLVGMLLPVCSIGVIPILRELRRAGMRPGAITAFAIAAPLFNPLSLLYGLTLSRPYVIVGFAIGSLAVVTILGIAWDRITGWKPESVTQENTPVSLRRLGFCAVYIGRELCGPTGLMALIAISGLMLLAAILPMGALQSSAEQTDAKAPLMMALVATPIYATPMLTMSQMGMMFTHGNSPGAAFGLLLLGTGVNFATIYWTAKNYGVRATLVWFAVLFFVVVGIAYAIDRPLIPPGVEPAGHTHAFDIYTNPFYRDQAISWSAMGDAIVKNSSKWTVLASLIGLGLCLFGGVLLRTVFCKPIDAFLANVPTMEEKDFQGVHRKVTERTVGTTCLVGLIAFSVVGCYAFYYPPSEVLEDMRLTRGEVLSAAMSKDYPTAINSIPQLERLSRILEVGYALRNYELRPYQRTQAQLLRNKLELLEHACQNLIDAKKNADSKIDVQHEMEEIDQLRKEISANAARLVKAFEAVSSS